MRWPVCYRYLSRLNVPTTEGERSRVETTLGALRIMLGVLALLAFFLDTPEPPQFAHLVRALLGLWVLYSVAVFAWVANHPVPVSVLRAMHLADIFWPTLITVFSHGPSSPFLPIFSFALLSAGFRWGFPEALLTSAAGSLVLQIEAFLLHGTAWGDFETDRVLVRCAYLVALGYLIGTLGENGKERRAESVVITRMLHATRSEHSLSSVLYVVFQEIFSIFGGTRMFLVSHEAASGRVFLWQMPNSRRKETRPYVREIVSEDRFAWLLPSLPDNFYCRQSSPSTVSMLTPAPKPQTRVVEGTIPELPFYSGAPKSMLTVSAALGREWRLRLLIIDARLGRNAFQELEFACSLFEQAAGAIYGVFLVRRLRARASAMERARVARELHDGAIQSLISTEMRANILRRRAEKECPALTQEIESLEILLRGQVIELRQLMQQLKPVEVEPDQLIEHLAELVDRFRRDTGISARFVCATDEVHLSPHICRELLLIAQEALVNVRKHANATDLLVTFGRHDGYWQFTASDDGQGFGFEGTLSGTELMKSAKGPAIIKERVASLGGDISIDSRVGRGSRLLIRVPQKGYATHER